jgi:hypothetical protein
MRFLWRFASMGLLLASTMPVWGQMPKKTQDFPRFKVVNGLMDKDRLPVGGASVCLIDRPGCFKMPDWAVDHSTVVYQFGLNPRVERLKLKGGGSLVFFSATYSGGGSGLAERLAVLRYEGNGNVVNLLPNHYVTDQSDRTMWNLPEISDFPVLVTADASWDMDAGETHFAWHRYDIKVFRFDPKSGRYGEVISYRTAKKYAGLDDASVIRVLGPERDEILRRLRAMRF